MTRTPLCRQLGIRYPIILAPMAGWTTASSVVAVARAGALGFLPAARTTVDAFRGAIAAVRAATGRPFGVNFLVAAPASPPTAHQIDAVQTVLDEVRSERGLPPGPRQLDLPPPTLEEGLEIALGAGVSAISFAMGAPGRLIEKATEAGAFTLVTVTSVREAKEAVQEGAAAVIAQGLDAGGHRATFDSVRGPDADRPAVDAERAGAPQVPPEVGTLALVPQVVDAVEVPVVAAGGIVDGRGVAAVLALGAQAAQLGTRFLVAREMDIPAAYRDRIQTGTDTTTRVTRHLTGRPARAIPNLLLERLEATGVEPLPWPWQALAANDVYQSGLHRGDAGMLPLFAGQSLGAKHATRGAGEIVESLVREAQATSENLRHGP